MLVGRNVFGQRIDLGVKPRAERVPVHRLDGDASNGIERHFLDVVIAERQDTIELQVLAYGASAGEQSKRTVQVTPPTPIVGLPRDLGPIITGRTADGTFLMSEPGRARNAAVSQVAVIGFLRRQKQLLRRRVGIGRGNLEPQGDHPSLFRVRQV